MAMFEFTAHGNQSLFGKGSEQEAAKLVQWMNMHRHVNEWSFRQTDNACDPVLCIADEIKRHMEA